MTLIASTTLDPNIPNWFHIRASERIDEDGEKKASGIGALITNRRRWRWRSERSVMEVKKESEGSYVTPLILDSQYLKDSYSR
jgi:hypothetical protein